MKHTIYTICTQIYLRYIARLEKLLTMLCLTLAGMSLLPVQQVGAQCYVWPKLNVAGAGNAYSVLGAPTLAVDGSGSVYTAFLRTDTAYVTVQKNSGSGWTTLNIPGAPTGSFPFITVDGSGTPYLLYTTPGQQAFVKKYNGSAWVNVGAGAIDSQVLYWSGLVVDGSGTPYVMYQKGVSSQLIVKKYTGSAWVNVGSTGYTTVAYPHLAISPGGVPYILMLNNADGKPFVVRYNGSAWETVGGMGLSSGISDQDLAIAIDASERPCIVFHDPGFFGDGRAMQYDGTVWEDLGTGVSSANASEFSIAIDASGTPYVAYRGATSTVQTIVRKYNTGTGTWEMVGTSGISSGDATGNSLVFNSAHDAYIAYADVANSNKIAVHKLANYSSAGTVANATVCLSGTSILSSTNGGGTWTSGHPSIATIDANTGVASGVSAGTTIVTYAAGTCTTTAVVSVSPNPGTISGPISLVAGATGTCSSTVPGGVWTTSNANASITSAGVLTAVTAGTSTVSYTVTTGCGVGSKTMQVSINSVGPYACNGSRILGSGTFSNETSAAMGHSNAFVLDPHGVPYIAYGTNHYDSSVGWGAPYTVVKRFNGATWEKISASIDSINSNIFGTAPAMAISKNGTVYLAYGGYTEDSLYLPTIKVWRYNGTTWEDIGFHEMVWAFNDVRLALDTAGVPCLLYSDHLYDGKAVARKYNGSTWDYVGTAGFTPSSIYDVGFAISPVTNEPYIAFPDNSNGNSLAIMKFNGSSWVSAGDAVTSSVVVGELNFAIDNTGTPFIFYVDGSDFSNGVLKYDGGSWVNVTPGAFAGVEDVSSYSASIVNTLMTIDESGALYIAYNTGSMEPEPNIMKYSGGSWQTVATHITGGFTTVIGGLAARGGNVYIEYDTIPSTSGVYSPGSYVSAIVPVSAAFTGSTAACVGGVVTLSNATIGGTWSTSNPGVATVGSTGIVAGVGPGIATIAYTLGSCTVGEYVAIGAAAGIITGPLSVATGHTITMTSTVSGGTWSVSNGHASIAPTGVLTGITAGTVSVKYTNTNSCGTAADSILVTVGASSGSCFSWQDIGNPFGEGESEFFSSMTTDGGGRPYIVYMDPWLSGDTRVARYNGVSWQQVGSGPISSVPGQNQAIAVSSSGTPYVAYITYPTNLLKVLRYDGVAWVDAGVGLTGTGQSPVLAFDPAGTLYLAYTGWYGPIVVQKLVGGVWSKVGGVSAPFGNVPSLAFTSDGTPYLAFTNTKASVVKYNGSNWVPVGAPEFSTGSTVQMPIRLAINNADVPYVGFSDDNYGGKGTVMNFNGTSWVITGTPGFGPDYSGLTRMAIDPSGNVLAELVTSGTDWYTSVYKYNGSTWASLTPDENAAGGTAYMPTMTLDPSGIPYIAYTVDGTVDGTGEYVKVKRYVSSSDLGSIAGDGSVAAGSTITLSNSNSGGTWSSSDTTIAKVGSIIAMVGSASGNVTGVAAGTAVISYATGACQVTKVVTVTSSSSITGTLLISGTGSSMLTSSTPGGTWSTSCTEIATVGSDGTVTGVSNGLATVSYTVGGSTSTVVVTVNSATTAITGTRSVCTSGTTALGHPVTGGTWTSSDATVATVSASGVVTGVAAGTANVSYAYGYGCTSIATVTVNAGPAPITGSHTMCGQSSTVLGEATVGGTWTTNTSNLYTYSGSGTSRVFYAHNAAGTTTVSYTLSNGCYTTFDVNVVPGPANFHWSPLCIGGTTTFTDSTPGGYYTTTWSSVALDSSGVVTGLSYGLAIVSYTMPSTGCSITMDVNVLPAVAPIVGTLAVCTGGSVSLTDATTGSSWSSSNSGVATVSSAGVVNGISAGTATITYGSGGCQSRAIVTVNVPNAGTIAGASTVAQGGTVTLTDGVTGGSWSASNGNATVSSGGVVTGVSPGTVTISYTVSNTCTAVATKTMTVTGTAPVTGALTVCSGSTTTLSNTTTGGSWSSGNNSIASVNSSGVVTGAAPGVVLISYTTSSGYVTSSVTVLALPNPITGTMSLCSGTATTLSSTATGGSWMSSNTTAATISSTGVVSGLSAGNSIITYTSANGCARTATVTVIAQPAVSGTATVCAGATTTLVPSVTGGAWGGGSAAATVSGGVVTALAAGTANITYTVGGSCRSITTVTVNAQPANITGTAKACPGTTITLTDATTGGTWSSDNSGIATAGGTLGAITGVAAGTTLVSYTGANGCSRSVVLTVNASPAAIGGTASTCAGSTTTLTNTSATQSWTSGNTTVATISAGGVVTGVNAGTANITFTASGTGCTATTIVTINGTPAAIGGSATACVGSTTTLTNSVSGGTWSSSNASLATIDAVTGVVTGAAAGNVTMTYTTGSGCYKTRALTVTTASAITGSTSVCTGGTTTLTSWGSGSWSSSNTAVATTPTGTSGVVSGISAGTAIITFVPASGCPANTTVTAVAPPAAITGSTVICSGQTSSLSTTSTGGSWSSSNTATATIGSASGVVSAVGTQGTVTITYAYNATCRTTANFTVNPLPAVINGTYSVCAAATTTLTDVTAAGTWSSSNTSVATVGTGLTWGHGAVSGITAGTANISFTISATGCARSVVVTVDPCSRPMGNETAGTTFQLYPNPTSGAFTLESGEAGILTIFTLDGREISAHAIAQGINSLSLSHELAAGIYMCRFSSAHGEATIIRLVKE